MFATDQQRRWWFATHPEYSQSHKGEGADKNKEEGEEPDKVSPKDVDDYVDNALKYVDGPVADLLKSLKRHFGPEAEVPETSSSQDNGGEDAAKGAVVKQLMDEGWKREEAEKKWEAHKLNKRIGEKGGGAVKDYLTARARWILTSASRAALALAQRGAAAISNPSRKLARNMTKAGNPRPSANHDAHHIGATKDD
ncbi:MAG: hypothetical protein ACOYXY_20380 [Thermodesulfobacteriota bacterium]